MANILITGFTPFAGRAVNASWLAAHWLAEHHGTTHHIRAALLPVLWGAPAQMLTPLIVTCDPDLIISLGEGHPGRFAIETIARNTRSQREDNAGQLPSAALISPQGPEEYRSQLDADGLCLRLQARGYPMHVSRDAGAFLCEETLYCLEQICQNTSPATGGRRRQAVFCHLPPFGTELKVADQTRSCDQSLLNAFSHDLLIELLSAG